MLATLKTTLHTVKQRVGYILEEVPETRDSDKRLLRAYWQHFDGIGDYLTFEAFQTVTSAESITRARREYQEHGEYLASENVQRKRSEKEQIYRVKFGRHRIDETPF